MPRLINKRTAETIVAKRREGLSINEICELTGAAKSTVWHHVQSVEIMPEYVERWHMRQSASVVRANKRRQIAHDKVAQLVGALDHRDQFIILGSLYWGEGTKRDFSITNADHRLLKIVRHCLKNMGVSDSDLRVTLRVFEDMDVEKCKKFWSSNLELPNSAILNVDILTGKKRGKLPYGMCRLRVSKGGDILKMMHAFFDYANASL
ncbi:MAG: hypothetical protein WC400_00485 [Patescibacteria group bacterium]|jgi:AcrR family transcriptional regulator